LSRRYDDSSIAWKTTPTMAQQDLVRPANLAEGPIVSVNLPRCLFIATCLIPQVARPVSAQEWTRFRGPNGSGASDADSIPATWTEEDYNWRVALAGEGHSQPVIWGERIFVTSAPDNGNERLIHCLSVADGRVLWRRSFPSKFHRKHQLNSFASSTPCVDEERVYVAFSTPESYAVLALTHDGEYSWSADLGPFVSRHSCGTSPIIFENLLIVGNEQFENPNTESPDVHDAVGNSFIAALERKSGKLVWKTPRRDGLVAYSTPCVLRSESGTDQLICCSWGHGIASLDVRTGAPIWEARLFDKRTCSSPILAGGLVIGTCGAGGGGNYLVALRPGGSGDVSQSHLVYKLDKSVPYVPTPVAHGDRLFLWSDQGVVTCADVRTGTVRWQQRVRGRYFGSPIRVRDRLYCMSVEGDCVVLAAGTEFLVLGRNPLGEGSHSTPAIADGRMYLRTFGHLISIGGTKRP
jgi:outer membrane protein assembly factor BamB